MVSSLFFLLVIISVVYTTNNDLYKLSIVDIHGEDIIMQNYANKILLVVNVASECGYTEYNYYHLVKLQEEYSPEIFTVLGFPCNQFGKQEPASNTNILQHVKRKYHVNFPLFAKIDVSGPSISSIYKYLFEVTGKSPQWNFCKYLIDQNGSVMQYFTQQQPFEEIKESIDNLIMKHNEL